MKANRGVSLVELLLTMSACCAILTLSAGLIHRALHVQTKARAFAQIERDALRLGNAFRRDVHSALDAKSGNAVVGENVVLQLRLPGDETVEYRHTAGIVQRVGLAGEIVKSREEFRFPPQVAVGVEQAMPRTVVLSIALPQVQAASPDKKSQLPELMTPVSLRVEAVLRGDKAALRAPTQGKTT